MSYESDLLRDWYLLFHYGSPGEILHGVAFDISLFPTRCLEFPVTTVEAAGLGMPILRALDLGCAVGRSTLELSRRSEEVIGIDFSASFIGTADLIRSGKRVSYRRFGEMHLPETLEVRLPAGVNPDRVSYEVGDAMDLRANLGDFDLVHAANLLCRLPDPGRFLDRLPSLVKSGGILVIATPATWLEEYTPAENRPTGLTLEFLQKHFAGTFDLVSVTEIPFLIREHQRKLQLSTSQTSVWSRR